MKILIKSKQNLVHGMYIMKIFNNSTFFHNTQKGKCKQMATQQQTKHRKPVTWEVKKQVPQKRT